MKKDDAIILSNEKTAKDVYRMVLKTSIAKEASCGQFVQLQADGFFLRRPISICSVHDDTLVLVYKTVGEGTLAMSRMAKGHAVSLIGPLGTGFPVKEKDVLLIGGGVGVPPLLFAAEEYRKLGRNVTAVLGFNDRGSVILEEEFRKLGCGTYVATMDGSYGTKGTVIDAIAENGITETFVLSCGPLPMLKAVSEKYTDGYVSLESRMACGFGACMGCVVKDTEGGSLRVCKDGPVFEIGKAVL